MVHAPMDAARLSELLRRSVVRRPVEVTQRPRFMEPRVPQSGLHLSDLPNVLIALIFAINNFVDPNLDIFARRTREECFALFAFVEDLQALRLVNANLSRRFKPTVIIQTVRRSIFLNSDSTHKSVYGANLIAFITMNQATRCMTEQGAQAFAYLKTYRLQQLLEIVNNRQETKELFKDLHAVGSNAPAWPTRYMW